jgi:hypothetical protein
MDNILSKDELKALIEEVNQFRKGIFFKVLQNRIAVNRDACATMPVYDNESIAHREFLRGVVEGTEWVTKDIDGYIDQMDKLLQKREK